MVKPVREITIVIMTNGIINMKLEKGNKKIRIVPNNILMIIHKDSRFSGCVRVDGSSLM